jgi:CubicO group peptidase (beta-lactamase class C family)
MIKQFLQLAIMAGLAYGGFFLHNNLPVIPGFVAQYSCGDIFISGRSDNEQVYQDAIATHPVFGWASMDVDKDAKTVTAELPFGLYSRTALFREHLGCTLIIDSSIEKLQQQAAAFDFSIKQSFLTQPLPEQDASVAMNAAIDRAFAEPEADSQRNTRAVVVIKNGSIIGERYAPGFDKDSALLGWSKTKSLMAAFAGILVRDNKIALGDTRLFPQWQDERASITLENLLNMDSGLAFEETYDVGDDATKMLFNSFDASAYAVKSPLAHAPGTQRNYSSGTSNMLAQLLRSKTGGTAQSFFAFRWQEFFGPLGMRSVVIGPDSEGDLVGSSFMYATARDWARFGLLYLNDGVVDGQRILPEGWVEYTRKPLPHTEKGQYKAQFWLNAGIDEQGSNRMWPEAPRDAYAAQGHDKQRTFIIPSENMVIVRLGRTLDKSWNDGEFIADIIAASKTGLQLVGKDEVQL